MNNKSCRQNLVAGLIVMTIGALAFIFTFGMPGHAPIFPRIASSLLFALGFILVVINWLEMRKPHEMQTGTIPLSNFINPLYTLIIMIAYAVAINILGFYTATAAMQLFYMYHLGIRSVKTMVGVTLIVCAAIFFVFSLQLEVPLPKGFLI